MSNSVSFLSSSRIYRDDLASLLEVYQPAILPFEKFQRPFTLPADSDAKKTAIKAARIELNAAREDLAFRLDRFRVKMGRWQEAISTIENEEDVNSAADDYRAFLQFRKDGKDSLETTVDKIERLLVAIATRSGELKLEESYNTPSPAPTSASASSTSSEPVPVSRRLHLKAPTVPHFAGDPTKFSEFIGLFEEQVHRSLDLNNTEKFSLLKTLLEGKAETFLAPIRIAGENYEEALRQLKEKFGDKRAIRHSLMNKLFNLETARDTAESCRNALDQIKFIVAELRILHENDQGFTLKDLIQRKFPESVQSEVITKIAEKEEDVTLDELVKMLEKIIRRRELEEEMLGRNKSRPREEDIVLATLAAAEGRVTCLFCRKHLRSEHCFSKAKLEERIEFLRQKGHCEKCAEFHPRANCRVKSQKCPTCSGPHCLILCPEEVKKTELLMMGYGRQGRGPPRRSRGQGSRQPAPREPRRDQEGARPNPRGNRASVNVVQEEVPKSEEAAVVTNTQVNSVVDAFDDEEEDFGQVVIPFGAAKVESGGEVNLFIDSASQRSFILKSVVKSLQLKVRKTKTLYIRSFQARKPKPVTVELVELPLIDPKGKVWKFRTCAVDYITADFEPVQLQATDREFLKKNRLELTLDYSKHQPPEVLLGGNACWKILQLEMTKRLPVSGLFVLKTVFGNVLAGAKSDGELPSNESTTATVMSLDVDTMFRMDLIGIEKDEERGLSLEQILKTIEVRDGEQYMKLPFRSETRRPSKNLRLSLKRLEKTLSKYANEPKIFEVFEETFKEQLEKGVIEELHIDPFKDTTQEQSYLPWSVVYNPEKTTPYRIVYDGSAREREGASVNECLDPGPNLLPSMVGCMIRQRAFPLVFIGDLQKAFLQVRLHEESRDFTRFLWVRDATKPISRENFKDLPFFKDPIRFNLKPNAFGSFHPQPR